MRTMRLRLLASALLVVWGLGLGAHGGFPSLPACPPSLPTADDSVSTTLDTDLNHLWEALESSEDLSFYFFGQKFWKLEKVGQHERVFFTYGGHVDLQICRYDSSKKGFWVSVAEVEGDQFHNTSAKGGSFTIFLKPESWYGKRAIVDVGFSLPNSIEEKDHTQNVFWTLVDSFVHGLQSYFGSYPCDFEHSTSSGYCNNVQHHTWGAVNHPMRRLPYNDPDPRWLREKDGEPSDHSRPSARRISNHLLHQYKDVKTSSGVNMLWVTFGQMIDHDITLNHAYGPKHPLHQTYNIPVRPDDRHFFKRANDQNCKDSDLYSGHGEEDANSENDEETKTCKYPSIAFFRSEKYLNHGKPVKPHVQYNAQTSFLDLSQVYGNTAGRIKFLREYEGGRLKTSKGDHLPFNGKELLGLELANEAEAEETAGVAGDVRCNEQPYLTLLHTLWMREHNTVAHELQSLYPKWSDEKVFQEARKITTATYQCILENEWLPFLLGFKSLPEYKGYKSCVDPSISVIFATAAFRFGHSMVTGEIKAADYYWHDLLRIPTEKTLFQNQLWKDKRVTVDSLFLGASKLRAEEMDGKIQNALRNHLFSTVKNGTAPGFDLAAANIQRCRDHACPSWSDARKNFRLDVPHSWKDLLEYLEDAEDAYKIIKTYGPRNLYNLDPFPIGLLEKKVPGTLVGPLFYSILADQFLRLRDGDRFYYKNLYFPCELTAKYTRIKRIKEGKCSMKEIFLRNFDKRGDRYLGKKLYEILPPNAFMAPGSKCDQPLPILKPTMEFYDDGWFKCPYGADRVKRFFWNKYDRKVVSLHICNIDDYLVNGLKGFESEAKAFESCSGSKDPYKSESTDKSTEPKTADH